MDALVLNLVIMAVFGAIVAAIAHSRGRTPIGWFLIGFMFPCLGLILVLVLSDLNVEEERRQRLRRDNQRLREQIRKERQVADRRHAETIGRLGAHDAVLGVDTTSGPSAGIAAGEAPPELPSRRAPAIDPASRWHYAVSEQTGTEGPVEFQEVAERWRDGELDERSLVWTKGMDDWKAIGDLPDVRDELRRA